MRTVPVGWKVEIQSGDRRFRVRITTPDGLSAKAEGFSLIKAQDEALEQLEQQTGENEIFD